MQITLFDKLQELMPDSSKTTLRSLFKEGRVLVDEIPEKNPRSLLSGSENVTIAPKKKKEDFGLNILFEDKDLIVIDKRAGLLSVADEKGVNPSLHTILKRRKKAGRVYPIHRLDRDTSGLIMFAYTEEARDRLKEALKERRISRQYLAVVEGHVASDNGTWESHLIEDRNLYMRPSPEGILAITHFELLKRSKATTTLLITLETGRKNQIRVQAAERGHPVVGDHKYGASLNSFGRLALHAYKLAFLHPISQKPLKFESKPGFLKSESVLQLGL